MVMVILKLAKNIAAHAQLVPVVTNTIGLVGMEFVERLFLFDLFCVP
jgi:hypothetical protein